MKSSAVDSQFEQMISREIGGRHPDASAAPDAQSGSAPDAASCPGPARRGRPRSEGVETSIVEGMLRLMSQGTSLATMSIEAIAAEAKVGKATIYRRWPDKEALLLHLLIELDAKTAPVCEADTLRETLTAVLESVRLSAVNRRSGTNLALIAAEIRAIPALYAQYDRVVIAPRRQRLLGLIEQAQRRGELRADLDPELLGELFVGPMLALAVLHPDSSVGLDDPALSTTIVEAVLAGVGAPGGGSPSRSGAAAAHKALTATEGT